MDLRHSPHRGFTFLEILIALAIMSIVASVLLVGHSRALRAQQRAQRSEDLSRAVERAYADVRLGFLPLGAETNYGKWRVSVGSAGARDTNGLAWLAVDLSDEGATGTATRVYLIDTNAPARGAGRRASPSG